ncbi:MAG TPA: DUF1801 domain-containing protein [Nitrospiraceae bacterium]|nr:DUF1801 domain-containing protein [Nitrospiraceae bacterium]
MTSKSSAAVHDTPADTTEAVDALMKSLRHPAAREIQALRAVILQVHPSIREGVKWNAPSFRTGEYFATTNLRTKSGVGIVLHFGAKVRSVAASRDSIKDPQKLLKWVAKDRATANFADMNDLATKKKAFQEILRQWITHV